MTTSNSDAKTKIIDKKNKVTIYNLLINYGNILTEYNTTKPLKIFKKDDLQQYIVNKYKLNNNTYDNFIKTIPYDMVITRDSNNKLLKTSEITNKNKIYPKILPIIQSAVQENKCSQLGFMYITGKYVEANLVITNITTKKVFKTKYIGIVDSNYLAKIQSTLNNSDIIKTLNKSFVNEITKYKSQIRNFINWDFERNSSITKTRKLDAPITIDLYKYRGDIFQQFISGSTLSQLKYSRKIVFSPVRLILKYHKCN
jgi:hypothetical protein